MTKQMIIGMFGLAIIGASCDKHKQHYGSYDSTETRTYEGAMMAPDVDLSEQNYILTVDSEQNDEIILNNLYKHGTQVKTDIDGSALSIRKQSLDGFLEIDGNGTIGDGVIHLHYNIITPDGNVVCDLSAGKLE